MTRVHGGRGAGPRGGQEAGTGTGRGGERRMVPRERPRSYHGHPVVKPPVWTWEIPLYFFTGGLGGASAALAFSAELAGNRRLARRSWGIAMLAVSASPALLISDLGRPGRFLNMMRVLKPTSPMSVGSWLLAANGAAVAPAAAHGALGLGPPRLGRLAGAISAALGLPLASYTAVLVANTAVPVWSEARRSLPGVFVAGAAASAGAAATILTPLSDAGPARRLAIGGGVAELATTELMEKRLGELGEPYEGGTAGQLATAAKALTAVGTVVLAARGRRSRRDAVAGAALLLAGALTERWAVFKAGFQSAEDPRYTVAPQRERLETGDGAGAAGG